MLPREPRFFVSRAAIERGGDDSGSAADDTSLAFRPKLRAASRNKKPLARVTTKS